MTDLKISQFTDGATIQSTDAIAAVRSGVNTKVFVGTAASLDVGNDPGDVVINSALGSAAYLDAGSAGGEVLLMESDSGGDPVYPQADGSQILNTQGNGTVFISSDDTEKDFLESKIIAGSNITITKNSDSDGYETLEISTGGTSGLGTAAYEDVGTAIGDVVQLEDVGGSPGLPAVDGSALTGILPLLHIQDQKSAGTEGGTATSGSWETRTLNTELTDEIGSTLSSNEFTLPAGTYLIMAQAPATRCNQHQARLYNVTDAAVVMYGTNATVSSTSGTGVNSFINGVFTISGQKTFRIEHRVNTTRATNGYGEANSFGGTQVYTDVKVWKK